MQRMHTGVELEEGDQEVDLKYVQTIKTKRNETKRREGEREVDGFGFVFW